MSLLSRAQPVIQTAQEELPAIQNAVKQLLDVVRAIWKSVVDSGLLQGIIEKIKALFGSASNAMESLPQTVHQVTEARSGGESEGLGGFVGDVVDKVQDKANAAQNMLKGGKMRQPRYKLRWDWHLRNFLTALVPPAAMFVFFKLVALLDNPEIQLYETQFEGKDPITGKISTVQSPSKDHPLEQRTEHVQKEELHIFLQKILKDRLKPIEEELERLQSLMAESIRVASESEEKSKRIEKARQHSKKMIRSEVKKNAD
ncbi:unnamed protein product [Agarophyton chilense]